MPARRTLTMRQLRRIMRMHHEGASAREIAHSVGMARSTVQDALKRASTAKLPWPLGDEMTDEVLEARLLRGSVAGSALVCASARSLTWGQLVRELRRPAVTMMILWEGSRQACPGGYCQPERRCGHEIVLGRHRGALCVGARIGRALGSHADRPLCARPCRAPIKIRIVSDPDCRATGFLPAKGHAQKNRRANSERPLGPDRKARRYLSTRRMHQLSQLMRLRTRLIENRSSSAATASIDVREAISQTFAVSLASRSSDRRRSSISTSAPKLRSRRITAKPMPLL